MREFLWIVKAIADENRLRILLLLSKGELCVCQIIAVIGLAPSTVSKHVAILHQAGLVESRKSGRWVYYRLPGSETSPDVRRALEWVVGALNEAPQALHDRASLVDVVSVEPEELCVLQARHQTSNPFALVSPASAEQK